MNLLVIIVLIVLIWKIAEGYKRGMVKEIISFISLIVLCVIAVLIGSGLQSYSEGEYAGVAAAFYCFVWWGLPIICWVCFSFLQN